VKSEEKSEERREEQRVKSEDWNKLKRRKK
jgi:hypothetical protein